MSVQYEENLWNKIDFLHERYHKEHTSLIHILEIMAKFQIACADFSKTLKVVLNKNYTLSDDKSSTIYKSFESFIKLISTHSQVFNEINEGIKSTLLEPITKSIAESFQKEKEMYNSYCKTRSVYNSSKSSLAKVHKEFESRCQESENLLYNAKKSKMYSLVNPEQLSKLEAKASEYIANTALCEDRYINMLNDTNKARENEINSQKNLHTYYHKADDDYYSKIKTITGFFITSLKKMQSAITIDLDNLKDKFNRIKIEKDINDFIEINKTDAKPDINIDFVPYKPAPELVNNSIISSKRKDSKDLDVSFEVVVTFQKLFKNIIN